MPDGLLRQKETVLGVSDFEAAFERYARPMYWFLYRRTRDPMSSEDLMTATFEKAWRSRQRFHGGSLQAWLYRIARNSLVDYWRARKDIAIDNFDFVVESTETDTGSGMDMALTLRQLYEAIDGLPDTMRQVIKLRFLEQLPTKQIAGRLHMSDSNVRVTQYRALQQLRKQLTV